MQNHFNLAGNTIYNSNDTYGIICQLFVNNIWRSQNCNFFQLSFFQKTVKYCSTVYIRLKNFSNNNNSFYKYINLRYFLKFRLYFDCIIIHFLYFQFQILIFQYLSLYSHLFQFELCLLDMYLLFLSNYLLWLFFLYLKLIYLNKIPQL